MVFLFQLKNSFSINTRLIQVRRGLQMEAMKIEDILLGEKDQGDVNVDGMSIPVSTLKKLMEDGYSHLRVYGENRTVSLWGKSCSACFTEEQLHERK